MNHRWTLRVVLLAMLAIASSNTCSSETGSGVAFLEGFSVRLPEGASIQAKRSIDYTLFHIRLKESHMLTVYVGNAFGSPDLANRSWIKSSGTVRHMYFKDFQHRSPGGLRSRKTIYRPIGGYPAEAVFWYDDLPDESASLASSAIDSCAFDKERAQP